MSLGLDEYVVVKLSFPVFLLLNLKAEMSTYRHRIASEIKPERSTFSVAPGWPYLAFDPVQTPMYCRKMGRVKGQNGAIYTCRMRTKSVAIRATLSTSSRAAARRPPSPSSVSGNKAACC